MASATWLERHQNRDIKKGILMQDVVMKLKAGRSGPGRWRGFAVASLAMLVAASPAAAHKTFLASDREVWSYSDRIDITLSSALAFPDQETGVSVDRIERAFGRIGATEIDGFSFEETVTALRIRFAAENTGFSTLAVSTHPRSGEIAPDDVAMYFDELGAPDDVRAAFDALPGTPALMRSYSKHTKIFFCVDICSDGFEAAVEPTGQALEFTAVDSGMRRFRLLRDGDALAGHAVSVHTVDGGEFHLQTDATGGFEINPGVTGDILLSAIWIDLPTAPDGNYHSDQATLSVSVG